MVKAMVLHSELWPWNISQGDFEFSWMPFSPCTADRKATKPVSSSRAWINATWYDVVIHDKLYHNMVFIPIQNSAGIKWKSHPTHWKWGSWLMAFSDIHGQIFWSNVGFWKTFCPPFKYWITKICNIFIGWFSLCLWFQKNKTIPV